MRIALIADIHGNRIALETILRDCDRLQVDDIWCLGDVAVLGPDPGGCIDLLATHVHTAIQGNVDAWLTHPDEHRSTDPRLRELTDWARDQLTDAHMDWLHDLTSGANVSFGNGRVAVLSHGSPRSFDDVVAADTPGVELDAMFGDYRTGNALDLAFGGHTHIPMLRRWEETTLVNPGSVGLPGIGPGTPGLAVNQRPTWGEYAIVEFDPPGLSFSVDFHRVSMPMPEMMAAAGDMPRSGWWYTLWGWWR